MLVWVLVAIPVIWVFAAIVDRLFWGPYYAEASAVILIDQEVRARVFVPDAYPLHHDPGPAVELLIAAESPLLERLRGIVGRPVRVRRGRFLNRDISAENPRIELSLDHQVVWLTQWGIQIRADGRDQILRWPRVSYDQLEALLGDAGD